MGEYVEVCTARKPDERRAAEGNCMVYACDRRCAVIIEVGGGRDARDTHCSQMRLCSRHALKVGAAMAGVVR